MSVYKSSYCKNLFEAFEGACYKYFEMQVQIAPGLGLVSSRCSQLLIDDGDGSLPAAMSNFSGSGHRCAAVASQRLARQQVQLGGILELETLEVKRNTHTSVSVCGTLGEIKMSISRSQLMEMFISAAIGDLISRSMSFIAGKYCNCNQATAEENLQRLRQLLMRISTIVEEAEGRHVRNQGMLQQLKILRDEMLKGCYLLDNFRYRAIQDKAKDDEVSHSFALSRFNPAKRLRFPTSKPQQSIFSGGEVEDLQKMVHRLEILIADMKEFIAFLVQYRPMYRQPYSIHLFGQVYVQSTYGT
uniref:Disease resistance N-terminal domain-containing protein n=1 Tax=Oryza meridionalis TaxID=40149 RepID=A0A0E0DU73_9ORYZ